MGGGVSALRQCSFVGNSAGAFCIILIWAYSVWQAGRLVIVLLFGSCGSLLCLALPLPVSLPLPSMTSGCSEQARAVAHWPWMDRTLCMWRTAHSQRARQG